MDMSTEHIQHIAYIDDMIRQITWRVQKRSLHTLSRPDIALTVPQMVTLFAIHRAGTCRMSELADVTQQSAGTLTGIVDRLIEDGLVERVRDADDRRVVQVALTQPGQERVALVQRARCADMERLLRGFNLDQVRQFETLLHRLLSGMDNAVMPTDGLTSEIMMDSEQANGAHQPEMPEQAP